MNTYLPVSSFAPTMLAAGPGDDAAYVIGSLVGVLLVGFLCACLVAGISSVLGKKTTRTQFFAVMAVGCVLAILARVAVGH